MTDELLDLFLHAVKVDALSLKERPMADFVRSVLAGTGVEIREDAVAHNFGGECGNLICTPPGFDPSHPSLMLLAHIDTPRSTAQVRPVVGNDRVASDGTTALGVDNRAGTAVLLEAMRRHVRSGQKGNFFVVFTVAEEVGPFGSKFLNTSAPRAEMCFVFDCSKRPGTFIQSAVGSSLFQASFVGRASHAGVAPEKGVKAIAMAAQAIAQTSIGRLSPTMTANIGTITGGAATNVVPDRCAIQGEVREFDQRRIDEYLRRLESGFRVTAASCGGSLDFASSVDFPPFRLKTSDPVFALTMETLTRVGLDPHPIEYLGGSDANMLNAKGLPSVNLGIGAQNPHGNDEFILIEDLHKSLDIALTLIARSTTL
jgi:tripeptide aminopeptidase